MRFGSTSCPYTNADWQQLVQRSRVTIAWFIAHGAVLLDSWFVVMYCLGTLRL
jgi:hypothetical protein